ncbi:hypothetical protein Moror_9790 [Moniliophthora roreri MCA 2997]|uniref:MYND-type domain-containing protein n=1 Tax=Moniliophthora roreri (strain MCA 2997) TaxID=1381753 RepID=V2WYB9_MONRO|nr:hypothetical protein Moror_9790 [Moniliophthora roreri MCA 2997]
MAWLPTQNSIVVLQLDPVGSVAHFENPELTAACANMQTKKYVALVDTIFGFFLPQNPYHSYKFQLFFQGVCPENKDTGIRPEMSIPIIPNPGSPFHQASGRQPLKFSQSLPWQDCYISAVHSAYVRCRTTLLEVEPPTLITVSVKEKSKVRPLMREDAEKHAAQLQASLEVQKGQDVYEQRGEVNWLSDDESDYDGSVSCSFTDTQRSSSIQQSAHVEDVQGDAASWDSDDSSSQYCYEHEAIHDEESGVDIQCQFDEPVCNVSFDLSEANLVNDPDDYFKEVETLKRLVLQFEEGRTERLIERARQVDDNYFGNLPGAQPCPPSASREHEKGFTKPKSLATGFRSFVEKWRALARLKHLKSSVLAGSRSALQDIEKMISENPRIVPEVLPAILHHLPAPVPDFSAMDIPQKASIIGLAQSALVALGEALIWDHFHTQSVVDEIHQSWPRIWRWIVFLFDSYLNPESDLYSSSVPIDDMVDHPVTIHYAISKIIFAFTNSKVTGIPILMGTKGVVSLMIENFLIAAGGLSYVLVDGVIPESDAFAFSMSTMYDLLRSPGDAVLQQMTKRLSAHGAQRFGVGIVARVIFAIRNPAKSSKIQDLSLYRIFRVMGLFAICSAVFNASLVDSQSVYWICIAIRGLVSNTRDAISADTMHALEAGCSYLWHTLECFGHQVATEALKSGLLKSILKSTRFLDYTHLIDAQDSDDDTEGTGTLLELYIKLLRGIGSYTVYGSVCGVAMKALSRASGLEPPPGLAKQFTEFVTEMEARAKTKLKRDASAIGICWSSECPYLKKYSSGRTKGERIPSFRCTGCDERYYCSKECQKYDWKYGNHRKTCRQVKLSKEEDARYYIAPRPDIRDLLFFSSMIVESFEDVRYWLAVGLVTESRRIDNPDVQPDEPLVALLDYQKFPHDVEPITIRKAKDLKRNYPWDRLVAKWRNSRQNFMPILTIAPCPERPFCNVWTFPPNSIDDIND